MRKLLASLIICIGILPALGCSSTNNTTLTTATTSDVTTIIEEKYSNPVFEPILADPSIIRGDDGYFYVYGTQDYGLWGEEEKTAYIPILRSPDLVNFEYVGSVFTADNKPTWGTSNAGCWAPDIVKIGDRFLCYYSLSTWGDPNPGIGVAIADHPLGPWTDKGKVFDSRSIGVNNSIDPTVFVSHDNRIYCAWGSFRGIYGVELTADGLGLKDGENAINTKVRLAGLDTSSPWNASSYEAAYIRYIDNYYYMFLSMGTCCDGQKSSYNVRVARSTEPLGTYLTSSGYGMLRLGGGDEVLKKSTRFTGVGHNSLIQDDAGDWWIIYHGYDMTKDATYKNTNRRSLLIDKLYWTNGFPTTQNTKASEEAVIPYIIPTISCRNC